MGVRADVMGGTGEPTNDVLGAGVYARYFVNSRWAIGAAYDWSGEFDFERPWKFVGLPQDPSIDVIDASASSAMLSAWAEPRYVRKRNEWYWTAGLGVNDVEIDPVTGPTDGGGTFDITTSAGTEFVIALSGGYRRVLGRHWWLGRPSTRTPALDGSWVTPIPGWSPDLEFACGTRHAVAIAPLRSMQAPGEAPRPPSTGRAARLLPRRR